MGSERTVSDSHGRVHMVWFHGQGSNVTIYYGRNDPGGGGHWTVRQIPNSTTYPGFKVLGIARGEAVGRL